MARKTFRYDSRGNLIKKQHRDSRLCPIVIRKRARATGKDGEKSKGKGSKCGKNYKPLRRPYIRKAIRAAVEAKAKKTY